MQFFDKPSLWEIGNARATNYRYPVKVKLGCIAVALQLVTSQNQNCSQTKLGLPMRADSCVLRDGRPPWNNGDIRCFKPDPQMAACWVKAEEK